MHGRRDGSRPGGLDASQRHAQVLCLQHDAYALGLQAIFEELGDLLCEPLLDLQATGEEPNDSGELGETQDARVRGGSRRARHR